MRTITALSTMRNGRTATLMIASALAIGVSSVPAKADCSWKEVAACTIAYAGGAGALSTYCAKCLFIEFDTSGQGGDRESLSATTAPIRAVPYDPTKKGFGDYTPVKLPPDRGHPSGTNTGLPISNGTHREIPTPQYFRPR